MTRRFWTSPAVLPVLIALVALTLVPAAGQTPATQAKASASSRGTVPRTPDGHPNLQGIWNASTITPMERPAVFAGKATVTEAEAAAYAKTFLADVSLDRRDGGPEADRERAYPNYFHDRGTMLTRIDNMYRTSMIIDPPDGRIPPVTEEAKQRAKRAPQAGFSGEDQPGAFDDLEIRPLAERCLLNTAGPPNTSSVYNNFRQIVQTKDHVMILLEMGNHARLIPINRPHLPKEFRPWMGDSVARWEGDTLVIDTTNFTSKTRFRGSSEDLHVVERFTRVDADTLLYRFTVEDPKTWTRPWTGEYTWIKTDQLMYEYACHEGNYALGDILRGARLREKEAPERTQVK